MPPPPASTQTRPDWIGLTFLTLAVLTSVVDSSVMTVATPTILHTFHSTLSAVEWTTTIYSLFFGATMLLWGKLGSMFGYRRLFVIGSAVFALGSALVGSAPTIEVMVVMRALQGIGAAMFNPAAIALVALLFGPEERPLAYGINGMAGSIGVALGYVLGGLCSEFIGWRWAFYANIPICAIAGLGALRFIPPDRPGPRAPLDYIGAAQSLAGLGLLILGLSEAETLGWWRPRHILEVFGHPLRLPVSLAGLALLGGVAILILFGVREASLRHRGRQPVFDTALFALPSFRWGGLATMLRYLAQFTVNYGVTLYLQIDEGIPALKAALVSLPNALAGLIAGPLGGWCAKRVGAARSVQIGIVLQALGIAWVWRELAPTLSVWQLAGPFSVFGLGAGLAGAQLNTAILQDVPREQTGDASSAATTLRQLGASFAVAVFGLIASTTTARLALKGYDRTWTGTYSMRDVVAVMLGISLVCLLMTLRIPNRRVEPTPTPAPARGA